MPVLILVVLGLHVLPAVFWVGTTFALTRTQGSEGERLVPAQVGALVIAILAGAGLWRLTHPEGFGLTEQILALGAACALIAAMLQISLALPAALRLKRSDASQHPALRRKIFVAESVASLMLAVTLLSMVSARWV